MVDVVYAGFVIAGAFTLVVEAYRNFNATSARHPFELHPILKEVEVKNLCTTGEIIVGFVFYAALYIVAYAVLLTSAEVYGLLLKANSAFAEIGPTSSEPITGGSDIASLLSSSQDYTKPFAISAVIIASLSLGAVKPIESTMRALAHRLAGVPRGVYKVIENLQRVPYESIVEGYPTPLTAYFDEANDGKGSSTASLRHSHDQIRGALSVIDCLRLATSSSGRGIYFPLYNMERLRSLSDNIDKQYRDVLGEIGKLQGFQAGTAVPMQRATGKTTSGKSAEDSASTAETTSKALLEQRYSDLADHAKTLAANMMAFFAVLFIRNNRAIYSSPGRSAAAVRDTAKKDPIAEVREYVFTAERDEKNAFAISIVVALAISSLTTYGLYYIWRYWEAVTNPSLYLSFLNCRKIEGSAEDCALRQYVREQFEVIVTATSREQIFALAITVIPVLLVIIGREVRIEQQSWRSDWSFRQFPFLRFLTMSLLSGLIAVFLAALAQTAALWWETDFHLTETHIVNLLRENGRLFILQAGCGIILSMTALAIMDRRKETRAKAPGANWATTMLIALIGCLFFFCFQWFVQFITSPYPAQLKGAYFDRTTRNALIASGLPCLFLLVFAGLLNPAKKRSNARAGFKEARTSATDPMPTAQPRAGGGK